MISAGVVRDATPSSNMADRDNTNMEVDRNKPSDNKVDSPVKTITTRRKNQNNVGQTKNGGRGLTTTEYCEQLQAWMWHNYTGYVNWQSWLAAAAALPCPIVLQSAGGAAGPLGIHPQNWHHGPFGLSLASHPAGATSQSNRAGGAAGGVAVTAQPQQLPPENGNVPRQGKLDMISKFSFVYVVWIKTGFNDLVLNVPVISTRLYKMCILWMEYFVTFKYLYRSLLKDHSRYSLKTKTCPTQAVFFC